MTKSEVIDGIVNFSARNGGVMTVTELAELTDTNEGAVRKWARNNAVRRCGSVFVFSEDKALQLTEAFFFDDDGEE